MTDAGVEPGMGSVGEVGGHDGIGVSHVPGPCTCGVLVAGLFGPNKISKQWRSLGPMGRSRFIASGLRRFQRITSNKIWHD